MSEWVSEWVIAQLFGLGFMAVGMWFAEIYIRARPKEGPR